MSKPLFFFGAGAESDYNIIVGDGFRLPLLKMNDDQKQALKDLLGEYYKSAPLLHHNSLRIYLQTIYSNQSEAKEVFGGENVSRYLRYYFDESKDEKDELHEKASQWYKLLTDDSITLTQD